MARLRINAILKRSRSLPLDVTSHSDSCARNHRELATILTLNESLAQDGFEPLAIGSRRINLITELSLNEHLHTWLARNVTKYGRMLCNFPFVRMVSSATWKNIIAKPRIQNGQFNYR